MTQVLGLITHSDVFLVSDRLLTFLGTNTPADDARCKLVAICSWGGVGYTGFAEIEGIPTHEWICHRLADQNVRLMVPVAEVIRSTATDAFGRMQGIPPYPHEFLVVGFTQLRPNDVQRTMLMRISNIYDRDRKRIAPSAHFCVHPTCLGPRGDFHFETVGVRLPPERARSLARNIYSLLRRRIGRQELLRLLVDEIVHTSTYEPMVGDKVLAMRIPRLPLIAAHSGSLLFGAQTFATATFAYFERGYSELRQYGPAAVCGQGALANIETTSEHGNATVTAQVLRAPSDGRFSIFLPG
jgi:hypothetical protein